MSGAQSGGADEHETLVGRLGQRVGQRSQFCSRRERNHADQIEVRRVLGCAISAANSAAGPPCEWPATTTAPMLPTLGQCAGGTDTVEHGLSLRDAGERRHARRSHSFVVRGDEDRAAFNLLSTKRRQVVANLMRRRDTGRRAQRCRGPTRTPVACPSEAHSARPRNPTLRCRGLVRFASDRASARRSPADAVRELEPSQPRSACRARRPAEGQADGTGHRLVMAAPSQPPGSKATTTTKTVTQCLWKSCTTPQASAPGPPKPPPRISQHRCTGRAHRRLLGQARLEQRSSRPRPEEHLHSKIGTVAANQAETAKGGWSSGHLEVVEVLGERRSHFAWRSARTARGRSPHDRCGVGADVPNCSGRVARSRGSRCRSFRTHARLCRPDRFGDRRARRPQTCCRIRLRRVP